MDLLTRKAWQKIKDNAPDGVMSYKDYRQIMSWSFRLKKDESKQFLNDLAGMGLVKLGKYGFELIEW